MEGGESGDAIDRRRTTGKDGIASDSFRVESPCYVFGCADLRDNLLAHTELEIDHQVPPLSKSTY